MDFLGFLMGSPIIITQAHAHTHTLRTAIPKKTSYSKTHTANIYSDLPSSRPMSSSHHYIIPPTLIIHHRVPAPLQVRLAIGRDELRHDLP